MRYYVTLMVLTLSTTALAEPLGHGTTCTLGGVYVREHGTLLYPVAELLASTASQNFSLWVETVRTERPYRLVLGHSDNLACRNGYWQRRGRTVELIGHEEVTTSVKGAEQLPDILNRPFTGLLSVRSEETRIAQVQQQASHAIASCNRHQCVVACVRTTKLVNPTLRISGYETREQVQTVANIYRDRLGVALRELGEAGDNSTLVHTIGEVVVEADFRAVSDSEPRFGRDRLFYLTHHERGQIRASKAACELDLRKE